MQCTLSLRDTKNGGQPSRYMRQIPCVVYGEGTSFVKTPGHLITLDPNNKQQYGALVLIGDMQPGTDANVAAMFFKDLQGIDNMIEVLNVARKNFRSGEN